ncbi:hypothetical protein FRB94_004614 [Tulasnella sp. JGI-2019a]|nr:hypothetical protein FRB94_004614 [Tulasnella sp. JGI-2019a]KAG9003441.1 hypothetical protein FRB93_011065 [Tulasnella sp. JGI-2019a]KAG9024027.1 hypothetical protein FRB95_012156 [Tulasnella sp. JGI-2019a]
MKFSLFASGLAALSILTSAVLGSPTPSRTRPHKRGAAPAGFVYAEGGDFKIDGAPFKFIGANAYWMFLLNEDSDVVELFQEYKATDVKVVRVWAFREAVDTPPAVGNFTQLWKNGVATCSQDGIARLKLILDTADTYGIKVVLALTNNWAVDFPPEVTANAPPGYYSNSYGGIDTFVQQIKPKADHDTFYTDSNIIAAYKKWLNCAIPAFKDHAAVFSWELANDPRCQGAVGTTTSSGCNTATLTNWVNDIASFVKGIDPNHLVGAGDGGFLCTQSSCPKVNTLTPTAPAPASPSGGGEVVTAKKRKRSWLTTADVLKRARESEKAARGVVDGAVKKMRIRGGWAAPATVKTRRSMSTRATTGSVGPAYDGSFGVDTQDICASPHIDFCSLQIFPDQVFYGLTATGTTLGKKRAASDSSAGVTDQTINDAVNFILNQAKDKSKPTAALAVGVTNSDQSNGLNNFDSSNIGTASGQPVASASEQQTAISKIASTASSINAMFPWQQGSKKAHTKAGSVVNGKTKKKSKRQESTDALGLTPDDGYAFYIGDAVQLIWQQTAQSINSS